MPGGLHPVYQYHITGKDVKDKDLWLNRRHYAGTRLIAFLVAPLACCEARLNQSGCRVSVSVCGNFFSDQPLSPSWFDRSR